MAIGPRLDLRQSQSLVMTPQLQQAIRLLAASNLELEAHIAEAIDANPLLEIGEIAREAASSNEAEGAPASEREADALMSVDGTRVDGTRGDAPGDNAFGLAESQSAAAPLSDADAAPAADAGAGQTASGAEDTPLDISPHALDPERAPGDADWGQSISGSGGGDDLPDLENRSRDAVSLAEHLNAQIGASAYSEREALIASYIVGELDEAGYWRQDLRELAQTLGASIEEAEDALILVQSLEPTGVGARSLGECLALQAKEANRLDPAMGRLLDNLDLVAQGQVARLKRICQVDDEDFADMLAELRDYDPKPGLAFGGGDNAVIVPDVLITPTKGNGWDIRLNEESLPNLVVNRSYYVELREDCSDKESQAWLKEQLSDANWLVRALDQRQKTILKVASEVVKRQAGFFREGVTAMKPLILREVADAIEMHESTVSRVTSNKFLSCPRGTFELKYFFSSGVAAADGEGASSEAIKARIKALTDAEEVTKILSDQKLVDMLKEEGFDLARRTVAKYREASGIGSSAQRRREKKLRSL